MAVLMNNCVVIISFRINYSILCSILEPCYPLPVLSLSSYYHPLIAVAIFKQHTYFRSEVVCIVTNIQNDHNYPRHILYTCYPYSYVDTVLPPNLLLTVCLGCGKFAGSMSSFSLHSLYKNTAFYCTVCVNQWSYVYSKVCLYGNTPFS